MIRGPFTLAEAHAVAAQPDVDPLRILWWWLAGRPLPRLVPPPALTWWSRRPPGPPN